MTREDAAYADYLAAEQAHRELEAQRELDRCTCDYCRPERLHAVTILVGFTPAGDECRACPMHLADELRRRGALPELPVRSFAAGAWA